MTDVTRILNAIEQGDARAADELLPLVYEQLRLLAAQKLSQEQPGQTLQATALVHEAYIRLVGTEDQSWDNKGHFFKAAARAEAERQAHISQSVKEFLNKDLLASFDPYRAKGHEVTIAEILENAAEKLEGKFNDAPLIEASIRDTLGTTYTSLGKYTAAEPHLECALKLRRGQLGEEHPDTLNSMAHLSLLYMKQFQFNE